MNPMMNELMTVHSADSRCSLVLVAVCSQLIDEDLMSQCVRIEYPFLIRYSNYGNYSNCNFAFVQAVCIGLLMQIAFQLLQVTNPLCGINISQLEYNALESLYESTDDKNWK